jgi:hypothetical protein
VFRFPLYQDKDIRNLKGMAHRFNGNSHMEISAPNGLDVGSNGGSFTYTGYVFSEKTTACFFEWWEGWQQTHIWSWPGSSLYIYMYMKDGSTGWSKGMYAPQNKWTFYGVSFDYNKATLTLKVDSQTKTFTVRKKLPKTSAKCIYIGYRQGSSSSKFMGIMSCVMLFGRSLDDREMEKVRQFCKNQPD